MLKLTTLTAAALAFAATACAQTEGIFDPNPKAPADWAASEFGPDDRLGALNHLSPEKTGLRGKGRPTPPHRLDCKGKREGVWGRAASPASPPPTKT